MDKDFWSSKVLAFILPFFIFAALGGAVQRTVQGSWSVLPFGGYITYVLGLLAMVYAAALYIDLNIRPLRAKVYNPWPELDQYGYRVNHDFKFVAELEHELGFTHMSDVAQHCDTNACWVETQYPEYELVNGYMTMTPFAPLPPIVRYRDGRKDFRDRRTDSTTKELKETGRRKTPLSDDMRCKIEHELKSSQYTPGPILSPDEDILTDNYRN